MKLEWNGIGTRAVLVMALTVAVCPLPMAEAQDATGFKIVVHRANPTTSLTAEQVSRYFLKRDKTWVDGIEVKPVDLSADSPVRASFCTSVHHRPVSATKAYWQKLIFEGRDVPPPEQSSARKVLDYVRANRGGIGYVDEATPMIDGVKVIEIRG